MAKAALLPLAVVLSCLVAGLYGAVHNQISYTVAPSYFHDFKFIQFGIEEELRNRLGASVVGYLASWWMGPVLSVPVYLACLFVPGARRASRVFLQAMVIVVAVALLCGLIALVHSAITLTPDTLPSRGRPAVSEPLRFAYAGAMHNASYLGGLLGMLCGIALALLQAFRTRIRHS